MTTTPPSEPTPLQVASDSTQPPTEAPRSKRDATTEAAARRHELRAEQAARAADATSASEREALLIDQITGYRRSAIEALLAGTTDVRGDGANTGSLHRPADLWEIFEATPDQFFDGAGALDAGALADFLAENTAERSYLTRPYVDRKPPVNAVLNALNSQQTRRFDTPPTPSWKQALNGNA
ncbi:hypothetical protein [Salinibacterium sp. SWN1162]|uniref:hypothetical protein n=1 Tax=Salinibacterium sp. SWN1162 TaxID=2792053 RepID=UPI0018CD89DD|nr:hypothetical protein [Salinibacterium sp. SWN1162]MBH0009984.1 hypothetical protein [Salinibacterium sp. SWN1162]